MRFETRKMTGNLSEYYGIWNPTRRGWVKWNKRDATPAYFAKRDDADIARDKLNRKYDR